MLRSFLIYLSKAALAQKLVTGWSFAWRAASRFVAGEKVGDAILAIRELNAKGINATLDHLGEHTSTADEAANATEDILTILDGRGKLPVSGPFQPVDFPRPFSLYPSTLQSHTRPRQSHRHRWSCISPHLMGNPAPTLRFPTHRNPLGEWYT